MNEVDYGEPADVFISAHRDWIEAMHQKGLVDVYNVGYIARDELVLTTSKSRIKFLPKQLLAKNISLEQALKILDENEFTLILDNEGASAGNIGSEFVKSLSFQKLKLFKKINEDKTPFLNIVKNNPEYYSLMFASQAKNEKDLQILATRNDQNIFYQALVIAGDNMDVAREFLKFLKGKEAQSVLKNNGFLTN